MKKMRDSGCYYLGDIPEDWTVAPLKRYFHITKRIAGEIGHDVLSITQKGLKVKDITSGEGQLAADYSGYQLVEPGDFAMNHMDLLTGWIDCSSMHGVTSPDYRVFQIDRPDFDKRYFLYFFQTCYSARIFYGFGKGISGMGRWRLPADQFKNMLIPVPGIAAQNRIADYLDAKCMDIDNAIEAAEASIAEYEAYKKSVIFEAVTKGLDSSVPMKDSGIEWLGLVPAHWSLSRAKYLFEQRSTRGNTTPVHLAATQSHGMYPQKNLEGVVKVAEGTDIQQFKTVHVNDYVISLRSFQGGFEMSEYEGVCSPAYTVFYAIKPIFHGYFKWLFKSQGFINAMDAGTTGIREGKNINFKDFANSELVVPPLAEQKLIAEYLVAISADVNQLIATKKSVIEELKAYRKSLIYEVVTGKREI